MNKMLFVIALAFLAVAHPGLLPAQTVHLDYSTYLGGSSYSSGYGIAVDSDNFAYVAGETTTADFPVANPYQSSYAGGTYDAFASKFAASGSALVYSTYLGGSGDDNGYGIAVDSGSRAYVTGYTRSTDFPTVNPYQSSRADDFDVFVTKLSSGGSALIYSTYLGGSDDDTGYGITLDSVDSAYVTGQTRSADFPAVNPYQSSLALIDAFVSKLSSSGSALVYSTYLGGSLSETGYSVVLDSVNSAYIAGSTGSIDFPTVNPYQAAYNGVSFDAFVSKLSSSGSALAYSTYLGGSDDDNGYGIALDSVDSAYVTGWTDSINFPTVNPYQASREVGVFERPDAFVSKLSSTGSALFYSTYLGGGSTEYGQGITLDSVDFAYVVGHTQSSDFPVKCPYQTSYGGDSDVFVSKLSSSGSSLVYSSYLGGNDDDRGRGIDLDSVNSAYITGRTASRNFPTANSYQASSPALAFVSSTFAAKFSFPSPPLVLDSGDYNGDGTSDVAIFRPPTGLWAVRGITRAYFGTTDDLPVSADYDGDQTAEIGIFRKSSGLWALRGISWIYFGSSCDLPVPGDYDGDGTSDVGVFRDTAGLWAVREVTRAYFGASGDTAVAGYYDGDSAKDIGIFRGTSGLWALREISRIYFGASGDTPIPGDFDGDGSWDPGIFRATPGLWAIREISRLYFGSSSDQPVPADYNGDSRDDIGIFRDSFGLWAIKDVSRAYFGSSGDIPVTR